nr:immunoglobulin light chain junction region [Mus musculus]
CQLSYEDPRTF